MLNNMTNQHYGFALHSAKSYEAYESDEYKALGEVLNI